MKFLNLSDFFVYGFDSDHHSAQRLVEAKNQFPKELAGLGLKLDDGILVSTCNREELYFFKDSKSPLMSMENRGYLLHGSVALEKLLSTLLGVSTPVVGDSQIFKQIRKAFEGSGYFCQPDHPLNHLFTEVLRLGSKIRSQIPWKDYQQSFADVFFKQIINDVSGYENIALIGTGSLAREFLQFFKANRFSFVNIFGRDPQKVSNLQREFSFPGDLLQRLQPKNYNIIVSTISTADPVIRTESFQGLRQPLLFLDLCATGSIEPMVHALVKVIDLHQFTQHCRQLKPRSLGLQREIKTHLKNELVNYLF